MNFECSILFILFKIYIFIKSRDKRTVMHNNSVSMLVVTVTGNHPNKGLAKK